MKRKLWIAIPVAFLLAFGVMFAACGASQKNETMMLLDGGAVPGGMDRNMASTPQMAGEAYDRIAADNEIVYADTELKAEKAAGDTGMIQPYGESTRKLIKDISASVETRQYEQYLKDIEAKAISLGGHVASKDVNDSGYNSDWYTRSANLVLRVPVEMLDEFQKALAENGRVTNMNESVRDVTLEYTDVETHIKVLRTERDALLELLKEANSTEELLLVRQQLTQTRYELDALESQMRVLEDQITLSTVTLSVQEVERLSPEQSRGFWAGAWDMFRESIVRIGRGIRDFSQGFLGAIPYLVLLAIPVVVIILLLRRRSKKRKAR